MPTKSKKKIKEDFERKIQRYWRIIRLRRSYRHVYDQQQLWLLSKKTNVKEIYRLPKPSKRMSNDALEEWAMRIHLCYEIKNYREAFDETITNTYRKLGRKVPEYLYKEKAGIRELIVVQEPEWLKNEKLWNRKGREFKKDAHRELILEFEEIAISFPITTNKEVVHAAIDKVYRKLVPFKLKFLDRAKPEYNEETLEALNLYEDVIYHGKTISQIRKELQNESKLLPSALSSELHKKFGRAKKLVEISFFAKEK